MTERAIASSEAVPPIRSVGAGQAAARTRGAGDLPRYPGPRPFEDKPEEQAIFFGRDEEARTLSSRIRAARLLVFYGKSGLGKTSLLRAGVYPKLRDYYDMVPIEVKIGILDQGGSLVDLVVSSGQTASARAGVEYIRGDGKTLWEQTKTAMFWRGDSLQLPVLIFDQFEEAFTRLDANRRAELAREIGSVVRGLMPSEVRQARLGAQRGRSNETAPQVRVVLSLREEHLGALEQMSADIPGIFEDRFRLTPLGVQQAEAAICRPAGVTEEELGGMVTGFSVPAFRYDADVVGDMLAVLKGRTETVEPRQLQIVCQYAEALTRRKLAQQAEQRSTVTGRITTLRPDLLFRALKSIISKVPVQGAEPLLVTRADMGGRRGIRKVLEKYYSETIAMLPRRQRSKAKKLCDAGLLSPAGIRLPLEEAEILRKFRIKAATLGVLEGRGLVRRERQLDSVFYELSHDSWAQPILGAAPIVRVPRSIWITSLLILFVLVFFLAIIGVIATDAEEARSNAEDLAAYMVSEEVVEALEKTGNIASSLQGLDRLAEYARKLPPSRQTGHTTHTLGLATRRGSELFLAVGDLKSAKDMCKLSESLFREGPESMTRDAMHRLEVAAAIDQCGLVDMELGSTMEALKEHLDAVGLLTNLRSETRKDPAAVAKIVDRLATAQVHTADALQRQGRFQEAGTHADEGVALFASLTVRENPDSDWRRGLIEAKMAAASARIELGQQDDGDRLISEADAEVDELIRDDPLDLRIHRLSGEVKTWVANEIKYTSNDDLTAAIDMYRDAAAKLSRLSILAPDDVRTRREALEAIQGLANLFEAAGRHKEAYDLCDTVNQKFQAFVVGGSTRWKIDLAESDLACARMLVQLNRLAEARHLVHHGKRIAEEIRRQHPSSEDIDWRLTLAEALLHPAGSADEGERKRERQQGVAILSGLEARNALPRRWKPTLDALRRELRVQDEPRP